MYYTRVQLVFSVHSDISNDWLGCFEIERAQKLLNATEVKQTVLDNKKYEQ